MLLVLSINQRSQHSSVFQVLRAPPLYTNYTQPWISSRVAVRSITEYLDCLHHNVKSFTLVYNDLNTSGNVRPLKCSQLLAKQTKSSLCQQWKVRILFTIGLLMTVYLLLYTESINSQILFFLHKLILDQLGLSVVCPVYVQDWKAA